jgi:hypothetical protein
MPIRRLESLEEAEATTWYEPTDPTLWRIIASVWALADRVCPPRFPPGLYRHRGVEEMNRQRDAWERDQIRRQSGDGPES